MVPAVVVAESGGGGPPVPLNFAAFGGGREEQARAVQTVGFAEAECPVLIVRSGGFGIGSTFSDEVDVLALVGGVRSYPGFEGEGIAVFEIEDAIGTRVVNDDSGSVAGERDGAIGLSEAGVLGAPRAGDTGANVAEDVQSAGVLGVEGPVGGFFSERGEGKKDGGEEGNAVQRAAHGGEE